jgi:sugar O-acyltransferase (sialic acid O-acetyltransferase NeuD family)
MTERLVLVGAGGHASDVLSAVEAINTVSAAWDVVGLLADGPPERDRFGDRGVAHLGGLELLDGLDATYVLAVGWPATKRALLDRIPPGARAAVLVHPTVEVGAGAEIGVGVVVLDGAHLSAHARIGDHALVSYLSSVGHDTVVGQLSSVMPGAHVAGDVHLGAEVTVGAGALVLQGLSVGDGATVGAGAVVTSDVAAGVTVVGAPARARQGPT